MEKLRVTQKGWQELNQDIDLLREKIAQKEALLRGKSLKAPDELEDRDVIEEEVRAILMVWRSRLQSLIDFRERAEIISRRSVSRASLVDVGSIVYIEDEEERSFGYMLDGYVSCNNNGFNQGGVRRISVYSGFGRALVGLKKGSILYFQGRRLFIKKVA
jgi:transcription elongation GreA/GreB family factor